MTWTRGQAMSDGSGLPDKERLTHLQYLLDESRARLSEVREERDRLRNKLLDPKHPAIELAQQELAALRKENERLKKLADVSHEYQDALSASQAREKKLLEIVDEVSTPGCTEVDLEEEPPCNDCLACRASILWLASTQPSETPAKPAEAECSSCNGGGHSSALTGGICERCYGSGIEPRAPSGTERKQP